MLKDRPASGAVTASRAEGGKTSPARTVDVFNQRVTSEELFQKLRELVIIHRDEEYKLRITANDRLILTK
ncbi:MAG: hemin uptake protein HemP [Bdellovibrionales bacterium]